MKIINKGLCINFYLEAMKELSCKISFALSQIPLQVSALNITAAITNSTLFLMRLPFSFLRQ
jgi:hypothetical protein